MTAWRSDPQPERSFVPSAARAQSVEFGDDEMRVRLTDGRMISAPLVWFPRVLRATKDQRQRYEISGAGRGLYWPDLDEDVVVAKLLAGGDLRAS